MDTAALFLAYRNLEDKKKPKGQNSSEEDFRPSKKKKRKMETLPKMRKRNSNYIV